MTTRRDFLKATAAAPLVSILPTLEPRPTATNRPFVHLHVQSNYS